MRVKPAAMRVYPKALWVMAEIMRSWGWADMAQPVMAMTKPGMKFLLGRPSLSLLSQMPARPAHHQTTPMVVCCQSFLTQAVPHLCSVKVLTQPQAAMTTLSKNSWERPVRLIHSWPTSMAMVRRMP